MPFVKWRKGLTQELTPEDKLPIGKNTLELTNIQESANYTCVAASALAVIEAIAQVKVQCKYILPTYIRHISYVHFSSDHVLKSRIRIGASQLSFCYSDSMKQ